MSKRGPLDVPPAIHVDLVQDHSSRKEGFVWVRHVTLRNRHADGRVSAPYEYFMVERRLLDAVAIVLYRRVEAGGIEVVLRSQLRPPLAFRSEYEVPLLAAGTGAVQWEVPAGLIEPGERGTAGLFARASVEALEEVGVALPPERFQLLGRAASLSPGLIAEKLHFVCAQLRDGDRCQEAAGDGHVVEEGSICAWVPLEDALTAIDQGLVHDLKTEVALSRLAQHLRGPT